MKRKHSQFQPMSDQHRRFIDIARQLEADEHKGRFEEKLKQIATAKPKPKKPQKK
jgi:hypothetical protein